ncbi:hypothetical protein [Mycobacterium sp. RTGN5]|uniref:hypothetical protein n=1 Tax=Mycobacterium sp. RTGN5 TaxID=3016522 RepID=UPI0029C810C2|nr:hypothetical protein [Mycobacterium sp. RTGN5]
MVAVGHQRSLAATAAAVLTIVTVSCSSSANHSAAQGSESPPQRTDFTQVTESMFVDASAIPDGPALNFSGAALNSDGHNPYDDPVDPPECAPIFSGPAHGQKGAALWSKWPTDGSDLPVETVTVLIAVPTGQPDLRGLRDLLGKCKTSHLGGLTSTASPPLQHPGLPESAVAWSYDATGVAPIIGGEVHFTGLEIFGLSRGLYVEVSTTHTNGVKVSPADTDTLVNLFNDQVRKLEAA